MNKDINVLVVEDSEDDYLLLMRELSKGGYEVSGSRVETSKSLTSALNNKSWDLIISDNNLPNLNAPKALEITRQKTSAPFIIVSGTISEEAAVNAMRMGASDYIFKGNLSRLLPALKRELKDSENRYKIAAAKKALLKSEEQFKSLADSIGDIFFALDSKKYCTYWNTIASKKTGISKQKAARCSFRKLFPELPEQAEQTLDNSLKYNKPTSTTIQVKGSTHTSYLEMICYPYSGGVSIIIKDTTEAKKNAFNLKRVNKELETFMYRLSHDLKGPVASMVGLVTLAKKDLTGKLAMQYCDMLEKSSKNLKEVLENLLDVTKIKTGDVKISEVSLLEVSKAVISRLDYRISRTNAKVSLPTDDLTLKSDRTFISSILQNLIENAVKYGGNANERPHIGIGWEDKGENISFYVSDNGPGIHRNFRAKIFEMFYRANETKSGSGLGLYIVKSAVETIGGSISIKSDKLTGSTFIVELPKTFSK